MGVLGLGITSSCLGEGFTGGRVGSLEDVTVDVTVRGAIEAILIINQYTCQ